VTVQRAIFLPNFGPFGDPKVLIELARQAEARGWDGFYLWDHISWNGDSSGHIVDPWVAMAAIAGATERLRLGTMITPLPRRRPWKVARETATLDRLSGGRLDLGVGLGDPPDLEFGMFGEETDERVRAAMLDEGLAVLDGLWSGEQFDFAGEHYRVDGARFLPTPAQSPRVPVWIAGRWPNRRPFRRAARWDGAIPEKVGGDTLTPAEVVEIRDYVAAQRGDGDGDKDFDVAINGYSGDVDSEVTLADYEAAGVTHWLERIEPKRLFSVEGATALIEAGPPAPERRAGGRPLESGRDPG
jgi:alkanesulfonate monooxygenase SsuD/methylene tetrahydromethanopterin reductase-like flavin-dependent oxidoreductase (luciferase family)